MEEKKISIIVPIYNVQNSLERSVNCLLSQTYKNLEIILVDDGSTDYSGKVCDRIAEKDKRVKVIHKKNGGVSQARNTGLAAATGEYVQFADSDDTLSPDFCRIMKEALESSGKSMVMCGYRVVHVALGFSTDCVCPGVTVDLKEEGASEIFFQTMKTQLLYAPWNKLFIREKIRKDFREDISLAEDAIFAVNYLEENPGFTIIEDVLYDYYVDIIGTLSRTYSPDRIRNIRESTKEIYDFCNRMFPNGYDKTCVFNSFIDNVNATIDLCLRSVKTPFSERYHEIKTLVHDPQIKYAAKKCRLNGGFHAKAMAFFISTGCAPLVLVTALPKVLARKLLVLKENFKKEDGQKEREMQRGQAK